MTWLDETLDQLAAQPIGYQSGGKGAAEPTALAVLALVVHDRLDEARRIAENLAAMQQASGAVAVRAGEDWPGWPTSLAIIAWSAVGSALRGVPSVGQAETQRTEHTGRSLQDSIARGAAWMLAHRGQALKNMGEMGHNTELVGWAYAENTHSWVEPTAFAVLAMKAIGKADHPAAREGVEVLIDRQLPGGGLNYGNTYVLGQLIRAHIQPTGIGLMALAGETDASNRLAKSVAWLRRSIGPNTTPQSLAWALLGLRAHGVVVSQADKWLAAAAGKVAGTLRVPLVTDGTRSVPATEGSPHKLALLALAAKGWPK